MQANYVGALTRILAYEGGKVNDPRDPGGKTNQGITQVTYSAWLQSQKRPIADVYNISSADVDAIYKGEYWDRVRGDDLPSGLDLCVFDAAVNSGVGQATKWLEQALGSLYTGQIDGAIGSKVMAALSAVDDVEELIGEYCSRRLATLQQLKTWSVFGKGWSARIANVQKTAVSWVAQAPIPPAPDLSGVRGSAKAPVPGNIKPPIVSQVTAHMTTAATGAATVASQAATQVQAISDTFSWVKYVFGGLTLVAIVGGIVAKFSADAKVAAEAGTAKATVDLDADTSLPALGLVVQKGA